MKKKNKSLLLILALGLLSMHLMASPTLPAIEKKRARILINQTAKIIKVAHKAVLSHRVYNGYLAKAIAHQHVAREFYEKGEYLRALYFSHRARWFAIRAIETNGGVVPLDSGYSESDATLFKDGPNDDELDYLLVKEHSKEKLLDEEIISQKPDVEVK